MRELPGRKRLVSLKAKRPVGRSVPDRRDFDWIRLGRKNAN